MQNFVANVKLKDQYWNVLFTLLVLPMFGCYCCGLKTTQALFIILGKQEHWLNFLPDTTLPEFRALTASSLGSEKQRERYCEWWGNHQEMTVMFFLTRPFLYPPGMMSPTEIQQLWKEVAAQSGLEGGDPKSPFNGLTTPNPPTQGHWPNGLSPDGFLPGTGKVWKLIGRM